MCRLEAPLAPSLTVAAARDPPPVTGAFLGPVQGVGKLTGAVKADMQLIRGAGVVGGMPVRAGDQVEALAVGRLRVVPCMRVVLRVHTSSCEVIDPRDERL